MRTDRAQQRSAKQVRVQETPEVQGEDPSRGVPQQRVQQRTAVTCYVRLSAAGYSLRSEIRSELLDKCRGFSSGAKFGANCWTSAAVFPQERNSERIGGKVPQVIPQKRNSQRIGEKVPQVISQKRISEQFGVHVPQVIPQERISERSGGSVLQVIPQKRISEQIEGHIVEG